MNDKKMIYGKLFNVMCGIDRLPKDKTNNFHNYNYTSETTVKEAIRKLLIKQRILFHVRKSEVTDVKVGEKGMLTTNRIHFTWVDVDSAETLEGEIDGVGYDSSDKGAYKAITGSLKYLLMTEFLVPTGDDPEKQTEAPKKYTNTSDIKEGPVCKCGKYLVKRVSKTGSGKFWGCSGYPNCQETLPIN